MSKYTASQLVKIMQEAGMDKEADFEGCSSEEIAAMEEQLHIKLPRAYCDFLSVFGKTTGRLFNDVIFFYPDILEFGYLIPDSFGTVERSKNHYVFLFRDSLCLYFDTTAGSDPPVYRFIKEEDSSPDKVFDSFTEWLNDYIVKDSEGYKLYSDRESI